MAFDPTTLASTLVDLYANPLKPGSGIQPPSAASNPWTGGTVPALISAAPPVSAAGVNAINRAAGPAAANVAAAGGGGGMFAPFGNLSLSTTDAPPAWLAKNALAAYQAGNTKYFQHLLSDPTISGDPHLANFVRGLMAGDPSRVSEAQYYATNPSYNGWNNAAGDGIPGDGR